MRGLAMFLGVLLLFPGACSLVFMVGFGPLNSLGMLLSPFRSSASNDPYAEFVALVWDGSFLVSFFGALIIRHAMKVGVDTPPKRWDDDETK